MLVLYVLLLYQVLYIKLNGLRYDKVILEQFITIKHPLMYV